MNNSCPLCDRPIADTGRVCHACADKTAKALLSIADHWHELEVTLTRQDRIGNPGPAGVETAMPFSVTASTTSAAIRNTLTTWARDCAETRGGEPPASTPAIARWLAGQTGWWRHRDEAEQVLDELQSCWPLLRRTIDQPAPRLYCGPCDGCGADLRAKPGAVTVDCHACEVQYDVQARREWLLEQADSTLAHASLIARALDEFGEPVKPERIRQWASRGRLVPRSTDAAGRHLYAVREVRKLIAEEEARMIEAARRRVARHAKERGLA